MSLETKAVESPVSNSQGAGTLEETRIVRAPAPAAYGTTANAPSYSCPAGYVMFKVGQNLAEVERDMILRTMQMTRGNRTRAANFLGVSVRTLYTKLLKIDKENALRVTSENSATTPARDFSSLAQR